MIYIALFRGINVAGKNVVPMSELVRHFELAGCENVQSYVQSGNIVFHSNTEFGGRNAAGIAKRMLDINGFEPRILILTPEDLQVAVQNNPFPTTIGKALHFFFLESHPEQPNLSQLESVKMGAEEYALRGKVFYLHAPEGIGRSRLAAAIERALGVPATARNWNTVAKLVAMATQA